MYSQANLGLGDSKTSLTTALILDNCTQSPLGSINTAFPEAGWLRHILNPDYFPSLLHGQTLHQVLVPVAVHYGDGHTSSDQGGVFTKFLLAMSLESS